MSDLDVEAKTSSSKHDDLLDNEESVSNLPFYKTWRFWTLLLYPLVIMLAQDVRVFEKVLQGLYSQFSGVFFGGVFFIIYTLPGVLIIILDKISVLGRILGSALYVFVYFPALMAVYLFARCDLFSVPCAMP